MSNVDTAAQQQQAIQRMLSDTEFAICPQCKKNKLKVKYARANGNIFISCTGFPQCKAAFNLPKGISNITMLKGKTCINCLKRETVYSNLFKLEFETNLVNESMAEVLPDDDNTAGVFCVYPGCDPKFKILQEATYSLPNKKTFNAAYQANENGVPNYYYQKPEVTSAANGAGAAA